MVGDRRCNDDGEWRWWVQPKLQGRAVEVSAIEAKVVTAGGFSWNVKAKLWKFQLWKAG